MGENFFTKNVLGGKKPLIFVFPLKLRAVRVLTDNIYLYTQKINILLTVNEEDFDILSLIF